MSDQAEQNWPLALFEQLKTLAIRQVAYVPDAGHSRLLEYCAEDNTMIMVPLTSEQEGVALLAGAWLGGERGVLLMQSSGAGNCINMLSLTRTCRFPLLCLITMRGEWAEFNPWQIPMGRITADVLEHAGLAVYRAEQAAVVAETVAAAGSIAFNGPTAAAVLLSQRLIGAKTFAK